VQLDSTRAEVYRLLGVVYLNQNEPHLATTVLERAVGLTPRSWEDISWLGLAYLRLGNLARAEQAFLDAARLAPWKPQPHLHLADLYERRSDSGRAAAHRRDFERLRPASVGTFSKSRLLTPAGGPGTRELLTTKRSRSSSPSASKKAAPAAIDSRM